MVVAAVEESLPAISTEAAVAALAATAMATRRTEARPEKHIEVGKEQRRLRDDVDLDLLPIFLDEAREVLPQLGGGPARLARQARRSTCLQWTCAGTCTR